MLIAYIMANLGTKKLVKACNTQRRQERSKLRFFAKKNRTALGVDQATGATHSLEADQATRFT